MLWSSFYIRKILFTPRQRVIFNKSNSIFCYLFKFFQHNDSNTFCSVPQIDARCRAYIPQTNSILLNEKHAKKHANHQTPTEMKRNSRADVTLKLSRAEHEFRRLCLTEQNKNKYINRTICDTPGLEVAELVKFM